MTPLLHIAGIGFHYPGRQVLNDISLTLHKGSCTALIGPNGAGKTTLLRIAAGALAPSSGSVLLDGLPLDSIPRRQRSRLIALVPQQLDVPFEFNVQQIVEQGRTPYLGLLRGLMREDRMAVDRALDLADCFELRHRVFNELSGGERQRVKIALGLAQEPKLLLLDEPTQNLDIGRQAELIDLLHHLREQGITIFASIHDLHLVQHNFSCVHLLDPGRALISGTPGQVLTSANLTSAFHCAPGRHPLLMESADLQQECV
jgi:iron complex transport system ATP-binding protein